MNTIHESNLLTAKPITTGEYSIMGIALLGFVCLGVFLSWTMAALIYVSLLVLGLITYLVLKKVDQNQVIKLKEVYENEQNKVAEGHSVKGREIPGRISAEEGDRADRIIADALAGRTSPGERNPEDKSPGEEPGRSDAIPDSGSPKAKKRSKSNRFTPV